MNQTKLAEAYDRITHLWCSEEFDRANGITQHQKALEFLDQKHDALDVGCGCTGRFIDLMLGHGFRVEGIDISEKMIELARERHPNVQFYRADICTWEPPGTYDFITAWDSIWHVPLAVHGNVIKILLKSLRHGGICIFTMGGLDAPQEKKDSFKGPEMYYSTLGIPKTLELIANSGCVCRHLEFDQYPRSHVYVIAQKA